MVTPIPRDAPETTNTLSLSLYRSAAAAVVGLAAKLMSANSGFGGACVGMRSHAPESSHVAVGT